jgi:hypothetical protein
MLSAIRRLFLSRNSESLHEDKTALKAKLIAVAVARTTYYADFAH